MTGFATRSTRSIVELVPGLIGAVFVLTYVGMALGRLPRLRIDRAGIALIAAVVLIAGGGVPVEQVGAMLDAPTLLLLFGLMVLSAQFAAAGFYDGCAAALARAEVSPLRLLLMISLVAGGLSAVLANDVIAFAMTPVLCQGLIRRGLDPRPFLIALASATNAGSAATAIGNPQNIYIAQSGRLDFVEFFLICAPPAIVALLAVPLFVHWIWRAQYALDVRPPGMAANSDDTPLARDRRQFRKAVLATIVLVVLFATPLPREASALAIAALLMASRKIASRDLIAGVDWNLLVLFAGLFIVTGAFAGTPIATELFKDLVESGYLPERLSILGPLSLLMSNTIGNVPAVVLLLQVWASPPSGVLYALALLSTLAGNFLLVGSLANLIVVERAASVGVKLGFIEHAKVGVPMTLATMALAMTWLWAIGSVAF